MVFKIWTFRFCDYKYLDKNLNKEITNEILNSVFSQCSGDRLFYIVGCHMGLEIEKHFGITRIVYLIDKSPIDFFKIYNQVSTNN